MIGANFLTASDQLELLSCVKCKREDHGFARRANALLLLDTWMYCSQFAKVLFLDDDTVRSWHKQYQDVCIMAFLGLHDLSRRICVVGLRYAIAGVCLFKVILFVALSKFCETAAMTICAWVLARPKYKARCNPKSRFIVPKHCST